MKIPKPVLHSVNLCDDPYPILVNEHPFQGPTLPGLHTKVPSGVLVKTYSPRIVFCKNNNKRRHKQTNKIKQKRIERKLSSYTAGRSYREGLQISMKREGKDSQGRWKEENETKRYPLFLWLSLLRDSSRLEGTTGSFQSETSSPLQVSPSHHSGTSVSLSFYYGVKP